VRVSLFSRFFMVPTKMIYRVRPELIWRWDFSPTTLVS
jgi:hypothetical protein